MYYCLSLFCLSYFVKKKKFIIYILLLFVQFIMLLFILYTIYLYAHTHIYIYKIIYVIILDCIRFDLLNVMLLFQLHLFVKYIVYYSSYILLKKLY